MDLHNAVANSSTEIRSVFICPAIPDVVWDLHDTITPWSLVTITSIASPTTILLNALVIIAVKQRRELQRLSNILLSSLAVADLLVGAISMPLSATFDLLVSRQVLLDHVCVLDAVSVQSIFVICASSVYHLTLIAWERYVAIQKYMDYKIIVTRSRLRKLAIRAWFASLLTMLPSILLEAIGVDPKFVSLCFTVIVIVLGAATLILIIYFYVVVFLGVRKRKLNQISQLSDLVNAKFESKIAKTTAMITAALILSFIPSVVVGILGNFFPVFRKGWVFRTTETLMQLNSLANPLIYCYRDRRFRNAVLELIRFRKSGAIQPTDGAVRFVRRKNPFVSLEGITEQQNGENRTASLTRSASCGQAVVSDAAPRKSGEILLKRSMSTPSLAEGSIISCHYSQLRQPLTTTTAVIHAEGGGIHEARKSYPELRKEIKSGPQGTADNFIHDTARSKSKRHTMASTSSLRDQNQHHVSRQTPFLCEVSTDPGLQQDREGLSYERDGDSCLS